MTAMDQPQLASSEHHLSVAISEESKTAAKLLDVLSAGLGKVYEPVGIIMRAKANAIASKIAAASDATLKPADDHR